MQIPIKILIKSCFVGVIVFLFVGCSDGIKITIKNNSSNNIKKVILTYTGGKMIIHKLNKSSKWEGTIYVSSDSHIEMDFNSYKDKKYHYNLDVYIEKGNSGSVLIAIENKNKISYIDKIKH